MQKYFTTVQANTVKRGINSMKSFIDGVLNMVSNILK